MDPRSSHHPPCRTFTAVAEEIGQTETSAMTRRERKSLRAGETSAGHVEGHFSVGLQPDALCSQAAGTVPAVLPGILDEGRVAGEHARLATSRKSVGGHPGKDGLKRSRVVYPGAL